jgi:hypothetical protein
MAAKNAEQADDAADETGSELDRFEIVDDSAHSAEFAFCFAACWGPAVGEGPAWQWDKSVYGVCWYKWEKSLAGIRTLKA